MGVRVGCPFGGWRALGGNAQQLCKFDGGVVAPWYAQKRAFTASYDGMGIGQAAVSMPTKSALGLGQ